MRSCVIIQRHIERRRTRWHRINALNQATILDRQRLPSWPFSHHCVIDCRTTTDNTGEAGGRIPFGPPAPWLSHHPLSGLSRLQLPSPSGSTGFRSAPDGFDMCASSDIKASVHAARSIHAAPYTHTTHTADPHSRNPTPDCATGAIVPIAPCSGCGQGPVRLRKPSTPPNSVFASALLAPSRPSTPERAWLHGKPPATPTTASRVNAAEMR